MGAGIGGVLGLVRDMGVSEEESEWYMEGVRRGGALVTLNCEDDGVSHLEKRLKEMGATDIKEEAAEWRSAGWTGLDRERVPERVEKS